jgi:hypothetical protein
VPASAAGTDSRVTVDFLDLGDSTEVRLTHELLDRVRNRAYHRSGWSACFKRLGALFDNPR